jgi:hypothetical protein
VKYQDQINIESKIKVVRFIGELVKFRMYSKIEALYCLKLLLHDFTHHHIEMCCSLLESCGRFLFRNVDSHQRTKVYLVSVHMWTRYEGSPILKVQVFVIRGLHTTSDYCVFVCQVDEQLLRWCYSPFTCPSFTTEQYDRCE